MTKKTISDITKMTFEESLSELEQLVRTLESGGKSLDDSIEHYSRGTALKNHCETKLKEAKLKVEKIVTQNDGALKTEEFNPQNT